MWQLIVSEFMTVDGVMQAPGGTDEDSEGGFEHGGWQMAYFDEIFSRAVMDGFAETDALLLGGRRSTSLPPSGRINPMTILIAPTMNALDKYVVSTTLEKAEWVKSTVIKADVAGEIQRLKQGPGKDIRVIGSGGLTQTLIDEDLVDRYDLMIHPITLGRGKRLSEKE